ncbi:MAG: 4-hydroxy-tetrahydrodipicolinate reductase [Oscillospiraceae bacterium]|nr:4-hydroxy-tetrahydrodipicolinate reductase [Oscillospiraceae bacterium]
MVSIAICGAYGKMGRVISSVVDGRDDCRVIAGIDSGEGSDLEFPVYKKPSALSDKPDVIIDFSHPSSLKELLEYGLSVGVPLVLATTGYTEEQIAVIRKTAEQLPLFFSFNMSLGINLLVKLSQIAAEVLGGQFDIEIVERHHHTKIDAPSGTAIMLADSINQTLDGSLRYVYDRHSMRKKRETNELGIHSIRGGTIVGDHDVVFAGRDEVITLSHSAASKEVFAVGAVNAAVFIHNKPAKLYDMASLLN